MDHHQFYQHDQYVRRNRESFVHIVGRAPQIVGAPVASTALVTTATSRVAPTRPGRSTASAVRTSIITTAPTVVVNSKAATTTADSTTSYSTSRVRATTSSTSSSTSSSATAADASSKAAKSGGSTTTIVAVVIVVIVLVGLLGAFFGWRKYKANRAARGSGAALVGGDAGYGRHKEEDDDEGFGNASPSDGYGTNAEKGFTGGYGAFNNNNNNQSQQGGNAFAGESSQGAGMAGMGARNTGFQQPLQFHQPQQQQQQYSGARQSWSDAAPSSGFGTPPPSSYPPSTNGSTTRLINNDSHSQYPDSQASYNANMLPTVTEAPTQGSKSPFGDAPGEGKIYIVRNTFVPSQPDELDVRVNDRIQVLVAYDDGWALGINLDAGEKGPPKGVFPFDCVAEMSPNQNPHDRVELSATAPASSQFPQPPQFANQQDNARQLTPSPSHQGNDSFDQNQAYDQTYESYSQSPSAAQMGPPQLAPLRTDSPLGANWAQRQSMQGSNDPLGQQQQQQTSAYSPSLGGGGGGGLHPGGNNRDGDKGKRTSSLIASKDAALFVALGEAFDRGETR